MLTVFKLILKFMELMTKLNDGAAALEGILDELSWLLPEDEESDG